MDAILLKGVRTHNLKNFDLILPHHKFYVITGVSGSGKSSLAFDTLYAEGQRRFVESLSAYARQFLERMERPDADSVAGIPPAIAIEAKNVITNARSTVGTQTEINDYLRLLFARVGVTICPKCHVEVRVHPPEEIGQLLISQFSEEVLLLFKVPMAGGARGYLQEALAELERQGFSDFYEEGALVSKDHILRKKKEPGTLWVCADRLIPEEKSRKRLTDSLELAFRYGKGEISVACLGKRLEFSQELRCLACGKSFREPSPNLFSFNSPLGACPTCQGFGRVITTDWDRVIPDARKSIAEGAIQPWTKPSARWELRQFLKFCDRKKIQKTKPWKELSEKERRWILEGLEGDDYCSVREFFECLQKKTYKMHIRIFLARYRGFIPCGDCGESRLRPEGLWVRVSGKTLFDLQQMSLKDLGKFFDDLKLSPSAWERVEPVLLEIKRRVRFLNEVGLGYLSLARLSRTLSGGEVQRIHLATSLGSALVDTLYVLDEPSVGLHERDNHLLIRLLKELRDLGNTVVVVEHDRMMIESADQVVDLGPGGGESGGEILFQGGVEELLREPRSLTGQYLARRREIQRRSREAEPPKQWIRLRGAAQHNLKRIDVDIPLNRFVVITGVSGSGKSTLLYDILYHHYLRFRGRPVQDLGKLGSVRGFDLIDDLALVDQSPMGRTPRSNPATYLKIYEEIRRLFARSPQARREGFEARHFSFNVDGGRCPACKGDGRIKVEMHFLADVYVPCEACGGKRFQPAVLDIRYEGKNIDDVLAMTVEEAARFFAPEKAVAAKLEPLRRVGLGYLRLGQSAMTLSGGEAQRLKLAYEMSEKKSERLLYLFDEPTTGLHYDDIHYLMEALEELLRAGHSLVLIEHNMEVIRSADYVIDLGPEGGEEGGHLLYQGPLEGLARCPNSYTGRYLEKGWARH